MDNQQTSLISSVQIVSQARNLFLQRKEDKALRIVEGSLKKHPSDFDLKLSYAQLLGDISGLKRGKRKQEMRSEAIRLLRELCRSLRRRRG